MKVQIADCGSQSKKARLRDWELGISRIPNTESRAMQFFGVSNFVFRVFFILCLLTLTLGCATTRDVQLTQRDLQDQRNKITVIQRGTIEATEAVQRLQKSQADLENKTDQMKTVIQVLQARIDEIKFHAEKASNDTLAMREELVAKLKEQDEKLVALRKDLDSFKTPIPPTPPVISKPKPESESTAPASFEEDSAEEIYNAAYSKLKAGDMEEARAGFKKFLEVYPHTELSDNAQFWIGESYYREKKYEEAVVEFEEVVKKYPKENKVPDAMLKEGLALYELEKVKESKYILNKLVSKYPKSEPAKIAKSRLEEM